MDPQRLTLWLREAVLTGHVGAPWEGGFPRYAWRQVGGIWYEGRLTNAQQGQYKGYPVPEATVPPLR